MGLTRELQQADPTDTEAIRSLLSRGANPNPDHGLIRYKTVPLVSAATAGCIPTLQLLLDNGAEVNRFGGPLHRETALNAAITAQHIDAVEFLLQHGADPNRKVYTRPLACAIKTRNLPMMQCVLKAGADPNSTGMWMSPAKGIVSQRMCISHSMYEAPKTSCKKCRDRWLWVAAIYLLRQYNGNAMVRNQGTSIEAVYADIIAYVDKINERARKGAEFLADCTWRDPTINMLLMWGIGGALGQIGVPVPPSGVGDILSMDGEGVGIPQLDDNVRRRRR